MPWLQLLLPSLIRWMSGDAARGERSNPPRSIRILRALPASDSGIPGFLESLEWAAAGAAWRGRAPRHCLPGAPAATTQLIRKFPCPAAAIPITAGEPAPGNREAAHPRGKVLCFGVSARGVVFVPRSPGKRPALLLVGVKASHIPQAPAKILIHPWAGALLPKEDGAKGIRKVGGEEE